MTAYALARNKLWGIATAQHGDVTARQATEMGIEKLQMLVHRSTLERAAPGVYRFPRYPVGEHDILMLAVLRTRVTEAAFVLRNLTGSYGISAVKPEPHAPDRRQEATVPARGWRGLRCAPRGSHPEAVLRHPVGPIRWSSSDLAAKGYQHVDGAIRIGEETAALVASNLANSISKTVNDKTGTRT